MMHFQEGCYIRTTVPPFITGQVLMVFRSPLQYGICGIDQDGNINAAIVQANDIERQPRNPKSPAFVGIDYYGRRVYDSSAWTGRKTHSYRR